MSGMFFWTQCSLLTGDENWPQPITEVVHHIRRVIVTALWLSENATLLVLLLLPLGLFTTSTSTTITTITTQLHYYTVKYVIETL